MALTTNQLVVGMFNMAAGGYTTVVGDYITNNGATATADALLAASGLNPQFMGTNLYDNSAFASALVGRVLSTATSGVQSSIASIVSNYMTANPTLSRGAVVVAVLEAVLAVPTTDATLGGAVSSFTSKVALADASTSTSTDFTTLAAVVGSTPAATEGQTFTLTSSIDTVTGTSGNDTIIGDANTASAADQLTGGAGTDTLKLYGATSVPVFSGIENLYMSGRTTSYDVSGKSDVTSFTLSDPTDAQTFTVTSGQAVAIDTVVAGETVTVAGNTPTSLNLTLNSYAATGADATLALSGTALATLNITTATAASQVTLTNAGGGLATITVAGDKKLELGHALTTVKTIDASASTGGVDVDTVGASALAFTGGSGDDRIDLVATLTSTDAIIGGSGTDTIALSGAADATFTSTTGAKISGFEIFEIGETADAKTYDVDNLIANNALTGIKLTITGAGATTTVSDINSGATGNITFTGDAPEATLTAKDFVSGGTSDTATLNLNNTTSDNADGVDLTLTFTNVDVLNVVTTKSDTQGLQQNSAVLTTSDAEKIVVTGDDSCLIQTVAGTVPTEIDGSGMTSTAVLSVDTDASAIASILVKATANADSIDIDNAATVGSTIYTGGGDDAMLLVGSATAVNTLKFTGTALNAGDIKAGDVLTIALASGADAGVVNFDFTSTLEGLLKNGGTNLGTTTSNVTIAGTSLSANTNVAATITDAASDTCVVQIDLNGDGTYTEANDWQCTITLTGVGDGSSTFVYNQSTDLFVFTVGVA